MTATSKPAMSMTTTEYDSHKYKAEVCLTTTSMPAMCVTATSLTDMRITATRTRAMHKKSDEDDEVLERLHLFASTHQDRL